MRVVTGRVGSWRVALLVVSVAAAFADASIVVLGLPEMYADFFGASVFSLALVVVAYNLVVAVVAFAVHPFVDRRMDARRTALLGLAVFLAACIGCAVAQSMEVLIVFRFAQGLGAGLVIVSSLNLLRRMASTAHQGITLWGGAGIIGAAIGPPFGGALTQLFGWRAIFVGVGVLAIPGIVALLRLRPAPAAQPLEAAGEPQGGGSGWSLAATELALYSTLVCALFLTITMLVDVWLLSPIEAAGVLTTLPVAALLGWGAARRLRGLTGPVAGLVLLALALLALAFVPQIHVWITVLALALCGFGIGLVVPYLNLVVASGGSEPEAAAHSVGFRHLGLVLGILVVGPLTLYGLQTSVKPAVAVGIAGVLESPVPLVEKVSLGVQAARAFAEVNPGEIPDVEQLAGVLSPESQDALIDSVAGRVQPVFTRALRWSYIAGAILALLALWPLRRVPRPRGGPGSRDGAGGGGARDRLALGAVALVLAGGVALVAWELTAGAASFGKGGREEACAGLVRETEPANVRETAQRAIEEAVYVTACTVAKAPPELLQALVDGAQEGDVVGALRGELRNAFEKYRAELGDKVAGRLESLAQAEPVQLVLNGKRIVEAVVGLGG